MLPNFAAAEFAVTGVKVVIVGITIYAMAFATGGASIALLEFVYEFCANDTGWDCDDGVTEYHCQACYELSHRSLRRDIAIANCGYCDNSPVDRTGDVVKSVFRSFDDKHQCTENNDQGYNRKQEDEYFPSRLDQGSVKQVRFPHVAKQFQYSEYTQYSHNANNDQVLRRRKKKRDISRQDRNQVNQAIKAKDITSNIFRAVYPEKVFDSKNDGEKPFQAEQENPILVMITFYGVD